MVSDIGLNVVLSLNIRDCVTFHSQTSMILNSLIPVYFAGFK